MKKRMNVLLVIGAMVFALSACAVANAQDANNGAGAGAKKHGQRKWMQSLTQEQRTQVQAKMKEMRAAGKTPEEIKAAIAEMLKGWNIQMPQAGEGRRAGKGQPVVGKQILEKLTPDQKTQLEARVNELKAAGKTPAEIRAAVAELLKGWGIELPAGRQGQMAGLMAKLTPDQRAQLQAKMKEMKAAGKTQPEIRAAMLEMLKGWGIEAPAAGAGKHQGQGGGVMAQLTADQRAQVKAKIQELKAAGRTREEIHAAIAAMLKGWGIEPPAAK